MFVTVAEVICHYINRDGYNGVKFNICRLIRNIEILGCLHLAYTKQNCSENVVVNIEIYEKRPLPPSLTKHTSQLFYTLS
jgi:hypothetical protein